MVFKFVGKPFIDKITIPEYDALPCLRSSAIKDFVKSPAHYRWNQLNRDMDVDNKNFTFGSYVHAAILEPDTLDRDFIVVDMKTRHNKEYYAAAAIAKKSGKSVILSAEKRDAEYIVENINGDSYIMELLSDAYAEVSAAAKIGDVWIKARMDAYLPERRIMIDIKTTGESIYWFGHNIKRWGYDLSAPFYMDCVNTAALELGDESHGADTYLFLVIEKAAPFGAKIFKMSDNYLAVGRTKYMAAIPEFKKCLDSGVYPGYNNSTWEVIEAPRNELENLSENQRTPEAE